MFLHVINIQLFSGGDGNIGSMVDIFESTVTPHTSEGYFESMNCFKPKMMNALKENSYISELDRQLDERSKYLKFNDL